MFSVVINNRFAKGEFGYAEQRGEPTYGEPTFCEKCKRPLTMLKWLPPHEVDVSKKSLGDVIFGSFPFFLVSEEFRNVYKKHQLTGITSFMPVKLFFRNDVLLKKYFLPELPLSEARIDIEKSGMVFSGTDECPACQKGGKMLKNMTGLSFERPSQITEDIFVTKILPANLIVSQKFVEATAQLSNLRFTPSEPFRPKWLLP